MRRHPEIRWKRRPSDIKANRILQKRLIENVSKRVKVGGFLVYSVCSFHVKEAGEFPATMQYIERWTTPLHCGADIFQVVILKKIK